MSVYRQYFRTLIEHIQGSINEQTHILIKAKNET